MPLSAPATTRARLVVLLLLVLSAADAEAKRKDDRLVLANGNRMTGEIKRLEQGTLSFKADYMLSAMEVDWKRVQELQSQDGDRVVLSSGRHVTGTIERRPNGSVVIGPRNSGGASLTHDWSEVLGLQPVEASFWNQLTGNLDSGFSYASGDTQTQFSASGTFVYAAERYSFGLSGSSTFSGQADGTSTKRNTIEILNQFNVRPRWYSLGLVSLLNSEQQDLGLRTTLGGAVGRWLVRTEHTDLTVFSGIAYTHETVHRPARPVRAWLAGGRQHRRPARIGVLVRALQVGQRPVALHFLPEPDDARPCAARVRADAEPRDRAQPVLELHALRKLRLEAAGEREQERLRRHQLDRLEVLTSRCSVRL